MQPKNIIKIHGNDYMTVAGRLQVAHKKGDALSISTEVLPIPDQVVIRATVKTKKGTYTGISAANPTKLIEKQSPYEVAETSAVGRALGFAGYGSIDSIASADEIIRAEDSKICTCGTTGRYHSRDCPARDTSQPTVS